MPGKQLLDLASLFHIAFWGEPKRNYVYVAPTPEAARKALSALKAFAFVFRKFDPDLKNAIELKGSGSRIYVLDAPYANRTNCLAELKIEGLALAEGVEIDA